MTDAPAHEHAGERARVAGVRRLGVASVLGAMVALGALVALTVAVVQSQDHAAQDAVGRFEDRSEVAAQLLAGTIQLGTTQSAADSTARLSDAVVTEQQLRATLGATGRALAHAAVFDDSGTALVTSPPDADVARTTLGRRALEDALEGRTGTSGVIDSSKGDALEQFVPFLTPGGERRVLVTAVPLTLVRPFLGGALVDAAGTSRGGALVLDEEGTVAVATGKVAESGEEARALAEAIRDDRTRGSIGDKRFAVSDVADTGLLVALVAPDSVISSDLPSTLWPRIALLGFALALIAVFFLIGRVVADSHRVERARREAQRANDAKTRFLSHITHELKQPLATIMGFSEVLVDRSDIAEEDRRQYNGIIARSGRNLESLVNELLDVSRIESGRVMLAMENVDLRAAIEEVFELSRPSAAERRITLELEVEEEHARAMADPMRLRQILLNLVSNAIKYNREAGTLTVKVTSADDETVQVAVVDEGAGLSEENIAKLFQPFERLRANVGAVKGTGLGLVICKGLVEAMGGQLAVESEVGTGSTFWFELRAQRAGARVAISDSQFDVVQATAGSILYIEDEIDNHRLVEEVLRHDRPGLELRTAADGQAGVDRAAERAPDLILLDLNLPDMSGEQVMRLLRSRPETAHVPVVILSAETEAQDINRLLKTGADAYLSKPLDIPRFLTVIDRLLASVPAPSNAGVR